MVTKKDNSTNVISIKKGVLNSIGKRDGLFESFSYGDIPIGIYCFKDDIRVDMSYCSSQKE